MGSNPERVDWVALFKLCNTNLVVRRRLYVVHLFWIFTLCTEVQFLPSGLYKAVACKLVFESTLTTPLLK